MIEAAAEVTKAAGAAVTEAATVTYAAATQVAVTTATFGTKQLTAVNSDV